MCVCVEQQSIGVQENASRPDGLPPSQGGKYVGFGSSPGPSSKPQRGGGGPGGLDDYQQYLSKGISQLTTVAGELKHSGACNTGWGGGGGERVQGGAWGWSEGQAAVSGGWSGGGKGYQG